MQGKQYYDTIYSSRNLEMPGCTVWHSCQELQYKDFRVIECQAENSAEDLEELDEFSRGYYDTEAWKPHSDCSELKKSTPKFVAEIQATIDNDPSMSIGFIASDMSFLSGR